MTLTPLVREPTGKIIPAIQDQQALQKLEEERLGLPKLESPDQLPWNSGQMEAQVEFFHPLGIHHGSSASFFFGKMMTGPDTLRRFDDMQVEHFVSIASKPGGGRRGVPVAKLAEWNFKLIMYFIN